MPGDARGPVPHLELFGETLLVDDGRAEVETALAKLSFAYGNTRLAAGDGRARFFVPGADGLVAIERDLGAEAAARRQLEAFGPLEVACLEGFAGLTPADYVIDAEGDADAICTFGAYAVPQLQALGWVVTYADDYRWRTLSDGSGWYARVADEDERGWFNLELGVEVDGKRVNLLPLLLDLLKRAPPSLDLACLAQSTRRFIALPVRDERYVALPPERLSAILRVLLELHAERGVSAFGRLRIPSFQAPSLTALEQAFGADGVVLHGAAELSGRAQAARAHAAHETSGLPLSLLATLRPYQRAGVAYMQQLRAQGTGGVLADEMGLGKTLQTIAHLVLEKLSGRMQRPALVVAPTSLVGNWQRELARFAPALRVVTLHGKKRRAVFQALDKADVAITTYPLLVRDEARYLEHDFHVLVLDEAQCIKNPQSLAHRAVHRLRAEHRLCLTGTPLENDLGELWALFDFLVPGLLGDAASFRRAFQVPIEREGSDVRLEALRGRLAPFILRRLKSEVAPELPPKTEIVRPVELTGAQRDLYESIRIGAHERVRAVIRDKGLAGSAITILDALLKLRQACCDPRLVAMDGAREVQGSAKYELLFTMLEALLREKHRVLVFSQFVSMLELIGQGLAARGVRYLALTGSTRDRQHQIDAFEAGEADVFLISLKAGGTGLNLTSADTVIHYDPWWNPAVQAQATGRAHRIGQQKPVFAYSLIAAGSVEERIVALQRRKSALAETLLTAGEGRMGELSLDDVEDLFAPLTGGAEVEREPAPRQLTML